MPNSKTDHPGSFAIQISRELGQIDSRLESIEEQHRQMREDHKQIREDQKTFFSVMGKTLEDLKNQHHTNAKELAVIRAKTGMISTVISTIIALIGLIFKWRNP